MHSVFLIVLILKSAFSRCHSSQDSTIVLLAISSNSATSLSSTYCRRFFSLCSPCTNSLLITLYSPTLRSPYRIAGIHAHYSWLYFLNKSRIQPMWLGNKKRTSFMREESLFIDRFMDLWILILKAINNIVFVRLEDFQWMMTLKYLILKRKINILYYYIYEF